LTFARSSIGWISTVCIFRLSDFPWAGGINHGDPHYYRVQTLSFLIEFDDTQDNANHIHSVWRNFNGDFGEDLLQQHYQDSHQM
jgi:hypothetical protein